MTEPTVPGWVRLYEYGWASKYLRETHKTSLFRVNRVERRQQGVRWIALEPLDRYMVAGEAESEVSGHETHSNARKLELGMGVNI